MYVLSCVKGCASNTSHRRVPETLNDFVICALGNRRAIENTTNNEPLSAISQKRASEMNERNKMRANLFKVRRVTLFQYNRIERVTFVQYAADASPRGPKLQTLRVI